MNSGQSIFSQLLDSLPVTSFVVVWSATTVTTRSVYVLVAILKERLNLDRSLHSILQILSVSLSEKTPIQQALSASAWDEFGPESRKQLTLSN